MAAAGARFVKSRQGFSLHFSTVIVLFTVPRKIRQLIADLKKAGFVDRGGKGSHRNFVDGKGNVVTISGKEGDDAKRYQERAVRDNIDKSKKS